MIELYTQSFRENWNTPAFSDFQGTTVKYGEAAQIIRQIHCYFRESGLVAGDKVAILGRNSANWAISFLAIAGYGAVTVPILPDFNPEDIQHILEHSESLFLFAADGLFEKLNREKIAGLKGVVSLTDFSGLSFQSPAGKELWKSVLQWSRPENLPRIILN